VLAGIDERAFIDIDSLLRPVYGHAKQSASFGHTKIAEKSILRRGLSPLAVTNRRRGRLRAGRLDQVSGWAGGGRIRTAFALFFERARHRRCHDLRSCR
jgi:hypothetical protein